MPALIAASSIQTCLGSGSDTFAALLRGDNGAAPLRYGDPGQLNVTVGYHVPDATRRPLTAATLLRNCVERAIRQAHIDPMRQRVVAIVGTGLRELATIEQWALTAASAHARDLHLRDAVREVAPGISEVITLSNACSAGGHALALAQDLIELGEADAVLACGVDAMTMSMLAMIGKVTPEPTPLVRPFDKSRSGVLLGEGAAVAVVVAESSTGPAQARLASTGLSCDAHHETAPDVNGITRAMSEALQRAGRRPADVDLVVAHGTGTALNDPAECDAIHRVLLSAGADPAVTAVKGALGHTSGSAALVNVDVAIRCMKASTVPAVVGLNDPITESSGLRLVRASLTDIPIRLAQINAFGFGGVNAVTLLEAL
ncbi:beta-ketoacyl synthase N-terminal-like domain-containing protein [Micromonospora sediminicola]|uniref:beta-ketoacyl synthase N-terminal-like domain-containing protein n=1 Tax=Micromonospora sediminicola TaxID=946078 RepID=UPI0033CB63E0